MKSPWKYVCHFGSCVSLQTQAKSLKHIFVKKGQDREKFYTLSTKCRLLVMVIELVFFFTLSLWNCVIGSKWSSDFYTNILVSWVEVLELLTCFFFDICRKEKKKPWKWTWTSFEVYIQLRVWILCQFSVFSSRGFSRIHPSNSTDTNPGCREDGIIQSQENNTLKVETENILQNILFPHNFFFLPWCDWQSLGRVWIRCSSFDAAVAG